MKRWILTAKEIPNSYLHTLILLDGDILTYSEMDTYCSKTPKPNPGDEVMFLNSFSSGGQKSIYKRRMTYKDTVKAVAVNRSDMKSQSKLQVYYNYRLLDKNDIDAIKSHFDKFAYCNLFNYVQEDDEVYLCFNPRYAIEGVINKIYYGNGVDYYNSCRLNIFDFNDGNSVDNWMFVLDSSIEKSKLIWEDRIVGGEGNPVITDDDVDSIVSMIKGDADLCNTALTMIDNCNYKKSIVPLIKILSQINQSYLWDYRDKIKTLRKLFEFNRYSNVNIDFAIGMLRKVHEYTKSNFIKISKIYTENYYEEVNMLPVPKKWEFPDEPHAIEKPKPQPKPAEPKEVSVETIGYDLFGQPIIKATTKPKAQRGAYQ